MILASDFDIERSCEGLYCSKEVLCFDDITKSIHSFTTTARDFAQLWSSILDIHHPFPRTFKEFNEVILSKSLNSFNDFNRSYLPFLTRPRKRSIRPKCDQEYLPEFKHTNIATLNRFDKIVDDMPETGQRHHEPKPPIIPLQRPNLLSSPPAERTTGTIYSAITK